MTKLIITIVEDAGRDSTAMSVVIDETENGWEIDNGNEEYTVDTFEEALDELSKTINEIKLRTISGQGRLET